MSKTLFSTTSWSCSTPRIHCSVWRMAQSGFQDCSRSMMKTLTQVKKSLRRRSLCIYTFKGFRCSKGFTTKASTMEASLLLVSGSQMTTPSNCLISRYPFSTGNTAKWTMIKSWRWKFSSWASILKLRLRVFEVLTSSSESWSRKTGVIS